MILINCVVHLSLILGIFSAQINYIKVPTAVRNNSNTSIILDCDYSIRPDDQELIIKWYLNSNVVYQWIPPLKPQSLGLLQNKLDLNYKASSDPKTVYRAMKIFNPTIEIAGEYKCFVSTLVDEDFSSKKMIVFEPESSLKITKSHHKNGYVNFTCEALNTYPQPNMVLFEGKRDDYHKKNPLEPKEWIVRPQGEKFSVILVSTAPVRDLNPGTLIYCELRIPGTGYLTRKSFLYYPADMDVVWSSTPKVSSSLTLLYVLLTLVLE